MYLDSLLDDLLDALDGLADRIHRVARHKRMQRFVLAGQRFAHFALLHRALSANYDLRSRLLLHRWTAQNRNVTLANSVFVWSVEEATPVIQSISVSRFVE